MASSCENSLGVPVPFKTVSGVANKMRDAAQCWTLRAFAPAIRARSVTVYSAYS